jgi:post-segregation antitoxin (ccd killing protein)
MRASRYDGQARRKAVTVRLNEDLVSKANAAGIDIGRTAERALAKALGEVETARIRADLEEAARLTDDYVARHGHPFADWVEAFSPEPGADDAA